MKAIGIVFTTMWKHEVLKQAQVPARDQASARRQSAAAAYRSRIGLSKVQPTTCNELKARQQDQHWGESHVACGCGA